MCFINAEARWEERRSGTLKNPNAVLPGIARQFSLGRHMAVRKSWVSISHLTVWVRWHLMLPPCTPVRGFGQSCSEFFKDRLDMPRVLQWAWHLVGGRKGASNRCYAPLSDSSLAPSGYGHFIILSCVLLSLHPRNLVWSLEYVIRDFSKPNLSRKHPTIW